MERFEKFKEKILARAKAADACTKQYSRALHAETLDELLAVVRDNFLWAVDNDVIHGGFIDKWKDEFAAGRIWHNCDVEDGFLLATEGRFEAGGSSSVVARDNSSVVARDNSSVVARDNSSVEAWDNSSVEAGGSSSVVAGGSSYITSYDVIECQLNEHATHRIRKTNTIRYTDKDLNLCHIRHEHNPSRHGRGKAKAV